MENITIVVVKPDRVHSESIHLSDKTSSDSPLLSKQPLSKVVAPDLMKTFAHTPRGQHSSQAEPTSLGIKFFSAGIAASIADAVTFPLDTVKVRLQVQGEGASRTLLQYRGVVGTLYTVARQEGVRAWYQGLVAGLQRQMCFASIRIGLYDVIKTKYSQLLGSNPDNPQIMIRVLAGITTGCMAVLTAQPTDVVKTRLQAQRLGHKRYSGVINAYRTIAIQEGISGLWKGVAPNMTRNSVVNVTELVSYDLFKEFILSRDLLSDNMPCHFLSGTGAGLVTTALASPVDVVKTRFMNSTQGQYRGALHCASYMYRNEGLTAFYKGCMPSFLRLTSWSIVMFVTFEQVKRQLGRINYNNSNNGLDEKLRPMFDRIPSPEDILDAHVSSKRFV